MLNKYSIKQLFRAKERVAKQKAFHQTPEPERNAKTQESYRYLRVNCLLIFQTNKKFSLIFNRFS